MEERPTCRICSERPARPNRKICFRCKNQRAVAAIRRFRQSAKFKAIQTRYRQSEKYKTKMKRYRQSEKGRVMVKRHRQSQKGRATAQHADRRKIFVGSQYFGHAQTPTQAQQIMTYARHKLH